MDALAETIEARTELLALLEDLTEPQWDRQSLCRDWRVRDVVAHLIEATQFKVRHFLWAMIRSELRVNRALSFEAQQRGRSPSPGLLGQLRTVIASPARPPRTQPVQVLAETVIHTLDIRRPLALPAELPFARAVAVADYVGGARFPLGARSRIAGLQLRAADGEWSLGTGHEVCGPIDALLLSMAGRRSAMDDLTGGGVERLRSRLYS